MPQPAYTRTALVQIIRERGPMSAAELTEVIGLKRDAVSACVKGARRSDGTKYFRIADWRRQSTGKGGREIPVYGLGPQPDEPRPTFGKAAHAETNRRYARKYGVVIRARAALRRHGLAGNPFAGLFVI